MLTGRLQLPSPADMAEDVRAQQRWRRTIMPAQRSRGSVLMLYMMQVSRKPGTRVNGTRSATNEE